MNDLQAKLNAKFIATVSLTGAFTGNQRADATFALFWDAASKGTPSPFLVAQVISGQVSGYRYGGVVAQDVMIQFKGVGVGQAAMIAKMETLIGVLDEFVPTLTTGKCTNSQRLTDVIPLRVPREDAAGADEFMVMVDYLYTVTP